MGLKRNVIILIYYMSNGLTFEILDLYIFRDIRIILKIILAKFHENRLIIEREINDLFYFYIRE